MKRFHVHIHVEDLARNIDFYSKMFGAQPARVEADYAKWMLDDPRVNFAISTRGSAPGVDHLGFQVDDAAELTELKARANAAAAPKDFKPFFELARKSVAPYQAAGRFKPFSGEVDLGVNLGDDAQIRAGYLYTRRDVSVRTW